MAWQSGGSILGRFFSADGTAKTPQCATAPSGLSISAIDSVNNSQIDTQSLARAVEGSLSGIAVDQTGILYVSGVSVDEGLFNEVIFKIDTFAPNPSGVGVVEIPIAERSPTFPTAALETFGLLGVAVDSNGKNVFAINRESATLSVVNTSNNRVVSKVS